MAGYKLNDGVCKAVKNGLEKYDGNLSKILLENNGAKDDMLSYLLNSFTIKPDDLSILHIVKNEFGPNSSQSLSDLVEKAYKIEELRIDN